MTLHSIVLQASQERKKECSSKDLAYVPTAENYMLKEEPSRCVSAKSLCTTPSVLLSMNTRNARSKNSIVEQT